MARVKKITLGIDTAPDDGSGIVAPAASAATASDGGDGGDGGEEGGELTSYARVKKRRRFKEGT